MDDLKVVNDLAALLADVPAETIVSRKVLSNDQAKVTLFGFAAGEELTEHTAVYPAILHVLAGEATIGLGADERVEAKAGTWIYMPAKLPHSVQAHTAVSLLLTLLP